MPSGCSIRTWWATPTSATASACAQRARAGASTTTWWVCCVQISNSFVKPYKSHEIASACAPTARAGASTTTWRICCAQGLVWVLQDLCRSTGAVCTRECVSVPQLGARCQDCNPTQDSAGRRALVLEAANSRGPCWGRWLCQRAVLPLSAGCAIEPMMVTCCRSELCCTPGA